MSGQIGLLSCALSAALALGCGTGLVGGGEDDAGGAGSADAGGGGALDAGEGGDQDAADADGAAAGPRAVITCFYGAYSADVPAASVEHILETDQGQELVHVRMTLDPRFVDNSYGVNSIGWDERGEHTFRDLRGSDHALLSLLDADDALVLEFKIDYIHDDDTRPSGYGTLGVTDGDGRMETGDEADVVQAMTSLDRNLNERGYASYLEDSPATDVDYLPNPDAPAWDFRVVYEVWVRAAAFGAAGFGGPMLESIHASPSKLGENTVVVEAAPCPPDWEECVDEGEFNDCAFNDVGGEIY